MSQVSLEVRFWEGFLLYSFYNDYLCHKGKKNFPILQELERIGKKNSTYLTIYNSSTFPVLKELESFRDYNLTSQRGFLPCQ